MSAPRTEPSPIESVVPLDADLAIVTVRKFDGSTTEYTASRHSAANKVRAWEAQPLRGVPPESRTTLGFRMRPEHAKAETDQ